MGKSKLFNREVFQQLKEILFGGIIESIDLSQWYKKISTRVYCSEVHDPQHLMLVGGTYDLDFIGVRKFSIEYNNDYVSYSPFSSEQRPFIPGEISSLTKQCDRQNKSYYVMIIKGTPGLEIHFDEISITAVVHD